MTTVDPEVGAKCGIPSFLCLYDIGEETCEIEPGGKEGKGFIIIFVCFLFSFSSTVKFRFSKNPCSQIWKFKGHRLLLPLQIGNSALYSVTRSGCE